MPQQTYTVYVHASAVRTIKVRADSPDDAVELAEGRIGDHAGPWVIGLSGSLGERFRVHDADGNGCDFTDAD